MFARNIRLSALVLCALALSGCATTSASKATEPSSQAKLELAVSETCADSSDAHCVLVNGEGVVMPVAFQDAGVQKASVVENHGQSEIDVTFTGTGAALLEALTEQAAKSGSTARLVMKTGDKIVGSTLVSETIMSHEVSIVVPQTDDAQALVKSILGLI
ncbi:hypothetical protein [Lacisediminihabitans changchengi]|uniref:Preprotein translocase subunit SecD n=1 Tax=Lacisediminihabitans changchengi TaxID=2787634 RepID=A0A934VYA3_9MICO|nr:hypothetical protein [Lacisediminihabitans changchengi]MBK4347070.1 hypothetical protein [Lacisediminihabitans changchengi]MBK4347807.1 hypothetical protein [Lacisediminihabitans changchengi]